MLEFSVDTATNDLGKELLHIWPSYLAYATSFLTIGVIWVNHHSLFNYVAHVDRALLFINTLLLLVVAFTPFPTRLIAEFLRESDNERTAATDLRDRLRDHGGDIPDLWRWMATGRRLIRPEIPQEELATSRAPSCLGFRSTSARPWSPSSPLASILLYLATRSSTRFRPRSTGARTHNVPGVRVALMIEGQEGVTWDEWLALAQACEQSGVEAMFRSDHYSGFHGGDSGSLDAWATINALAGMTETLRLGTLVSPGTFRHPSVLARMAVTADHVSRGRILLGMGAGWHDAEHEQFGFEFHTAAWRVERFGEQLELVHRQLNEDEPFDFHGKHYTLTGCNAQPKPVQRPFPIVVGGAAKPGNGTAGGALRVRVQHDLSDARRSEGTRATRGWTSSAPRPGGTPRRSRSR